MYFDLLEVRWGKLVKRENYIYNGNPSYTDKVRFNYVFDKADLDLYRGFERQTGLKFPKGLMEFYAQHNGCRLFLSSLNIYGFRTGNYEMQPFDLGVENSNIIGEMKSNCCYNKNLLFFGSCGDYVLAHDNSNEKIVCLARGTDREVISFENFEETLKFFIKKISVHYNERCEKDVPNKMFKKFAVLANAVYDIKEIL